MANNDDLETNMSTLQEMLSIPRAQAITLLSKYITVEQAVNQYFEDPTGAVKPLAPPNQWEPADNIPYADDTSELPGMSRPPSRVDLRAADTSGNVRAEAIMPSIEDMHDSDLQRAIAMSKQDLPGQDSGVVEAGQQFGPANRPYYDTSQWAMTTVASSREIIEHPAAIDRRRAPGQPAFLRGSTETGYLAPLLNIYHNIPLAREAFLLPDMRVISYGHDPQWWTGTSDENNKSISVETSDRLSQDRHNFLAELQCLMAFLDGTNRAYGSVDALADLRALKVHNSEVSLPQLLETWVAAAMMEIPDNQLTQIFTSTAIKAPDMEGYSPIQKDLVCLEPPVRRLENQTLVNLLDSTIWNDNADKIDDIWIHQCGEIFTMRLHDPGNETKGLALEVPLVWYPDRYLYAHRETTRQWRREMLTIRHEINRCSLVQRRCEVAQGPGKRVIKIRDVLEAASKLSKSNSDMEPSIAEQEEGTTTSTTSELNEANTMQSELQAILHRIDEKVKILERRKEDLQREIESIAGQLTQPGLDPDLEPRHKYYLQGVSTKPNITYVRRANFEPQTLIDTTTGDRPAYQWWRMVWGKDDGTAKGGPQHFTDPKPHLGQEQPEMIKNEKQPYAVYPVHENEVVEAAKTEYNSVVLVYANENAMTFTPSGTSVALKQFVEQDNRAFQDELSRGQPKSNRQNSQETNTTIMEDIPLDDRSITPSNMRDMTPMSITSPLRDPDGQPSPKRAKGDETHFPRNGSDSDDDPPPYDESDSMSPAPERRTNKIGMLAEQMLEKYGGDGHNNSGDNGPIHIEHARGPLR